MNAVKKTIAVDLGHLKADASGNLPGEIQLMPCGNYRTVKGDFALTQTMFNEAVMNFNSGVARVSGTSSLPINFNHEQSGPAAGWIDGLESRPDGLWAKVTWSAEGAAALIGSVYRFFSVEYWFMSYNEPDNVDAMFNNVVEGGALTNIPLMRKMKPVMADKNTSGLTGDDATRNIFLMDRSEEVPTLEQVRAKNPAELKDDEKKVLADNQDKLTPAEKIAFGLSANKTPEQIAADAKVVADKKAADEAARLDAAKVGMVPKADFDAATSRIASLEADSIKKDATAEVEKHVERGAIKAESQEKWVGLLANADAATRASLKEQLATLPGSELLANKRQGNSTDGDASLQDELKKKTLEVQAAAKKESRSLSYAQAQSELLNSNADLKKRVDASYEKAGR